MHPAPGVVEKKLLDSAWPAIRDYFTSKQKLRNRIDELERQLTEAQTGVLAFEQLKKSLVLHAGDDPMYWMTDGDGPFCHLCVDDNHKLIRLSHGFGQGAYVCSLHNRTFETRECREQQQRQQPRQPRYGPNSWMGR
jgi:hypothetical protein